MPKQAQSNLMLDTDAAANYLGLQKTTLETWRSTKRVELPYVRLGRAIRYRQTDLDSFLADNTVGTTKH